MKSSDVPFLAKDEKPAKTSAKEASDADVCAVEDCENAKADGSDWCRMHTRRLSRQQAEADAAEEAGEE